MFTNFFVNTKRFLRVLKQVNKKRFIFASNMWAIFWIPLLNPQQVRYAFMYVFYSCYSDSFRYFPFCRRTKLKLRDASFRPVFMLDLSIFVCYKTTFSRLIHVKIKFEYMYFFILLKTRFILVKACRRYGAHWYVSCF